MTHELIEALACAGLAPCHTLCEMLDEHPKHRTERRGCGLTQATRFLAERINAPRHSSDAADFALFADWPQRATVGIALRAIDLGWTLGWRNLHDAPETIVNAIADMPAADRLLTLQDTLGQVRRGLRYPESLLLLDMIADILSCRLDVGDATLPVMLEKPAIGSCSQAEEFFLEIAHGRIRRGGQVNIIVDAQARPILVEKIGLGESHSAMFVRTASVCDVRIPPGGLAALRYRETWRALDAHADGQIVPLSALAEVRFLRLTTLAVAPEHRERAFGDQYRRQIRGDMLSPRTTMLEDLRQFASARAGGTRHADSHVL